MKKYDAYLMISLITVAKCDFNVAFDRRVRYGFYSNHGARIDPMKVTILHRIHEVFSPHVFDFFYVAVGQPD